MSNIDYRYQLRVTSEWLDSVQIMASQAGMTAPAFIRKTVELFGPELIRRINNEEVHSQMED